MRECDDPGPEGRGAARRDGELAQQEYQQCAGPVHEAAGSVQRSAQREGTSEVDELLFSELPGDTAPSVENELGDLDDWLRSGE